MIRVNGELAALLGAAGLAVVVPAYLLRSTDPQPEHALRLAATQLPPPAELALRGTALEAPLFNPERVPPPPPDENPADNAAATASPASPPLLVGTIAGRGGVGVALVKNTAGETLTLHAGEVVDGWTLVAIGNGIATVDQNGRRETISLDFSNRASGPQGTGQDESAAAASLPAATSQQASPQNSPANIAADGMIGH